jgi:hypothetical protein
MIWVDVILMKNTLQALPNLTAFLSIALVTQRRSLPKAPTRKSSEHPGVQMSGRLRLASVH